MALLESNMAMEIHFEVFLSRVRPSNHPVFLIFHGETNGFGVHQFGKHQFIHPAPRGVAAHTAGYFSSYTLNSSALL